MSVISRYREGKISLGTLATKLELSMSEVIDLLAEYGVESTVTYEDYLVGFQVTG